MSQILNTVGLGLDVVGILLLARFGMPSRVSRGGLVGIAVVDDDAKRKADRYGRISMFALAIMVIGFVLQGVATWVEP